MPAFDSGSVVEPLAWSFKAHVKGAEGVVREPNDRQIADYLSAFKKFIAGTKGKFPEDVDVTDPAELVAAMDDLDPEVTVQLHEELAGIYAALCSGDPSRELLLKLPPRIRTVFYGWLQQEVMSPEVVSGGGSAQVTTLRSAAAG
jgi:hypothetical protein